MKPGRTGGAAGALRCASSILAIRAVRRMAAMLALAGMAAMASSPPAAATPASTGVPAPPIDIGFVQHPGALLPLHLLFTDERGTSAPLGRFLDHLPAVLVFGYFRCPNLCSAVRESLARSLQAMDLEPGAQYQVLAISIDPDETSAAAHAAAAASAGPGTQGAQPVPGWHFLTGGANAIQEVALSAGFRSVRDASSQQFAHPAGIVIATPDGRIARYFPGIEYPPAELRRSLVDADAGRISSPVRALLLRCLHFDPRTGRYSATVGEVARGVGGATVCAVILLLLALQRRRRRGVAPMSAPGRSQALIAPQRVARRVVQ